MECGDRFYPVGSTVLFLGLHIWSVNAIVSDCALEGA
jgi:hypothetical protein